MIGEETKEQSPFLLLFPGLKAAYTEGANVASNTESTTNVTKALVGQKADFNFLKNSQKLQHVQVKLENTVL